MGVNEAFVNMSPSNAGRGQGEDDGKGGAFPQFAAHDNDAPHALDNSLHHRQPQSGALTDRLGGEEWVKDLGGGGLAHAASGIGDPDFRMGAVKVEGGEGIQSDGLPIDAAGLFP